MTELETLKQDLELATEARDRLGRSMDVLHTCIEGSTAEEMRANINELRAVRAKYERLLPLVEAAKNWRRAMCGESVAAQTARATQLSSADLLFRAVEALERAESSAP